ncbi:DUF262 domain-containing protein [Selenomonas ruminantium]|uniref:DUF262 domain-containing protein n=1 Tax=Selenomonas ruminantium TaxID=971 RepID=UPI0004238B5D|nr:DUF262 domain-containing protein [Selenomonas ruminantium]
MMSNLAEIMEKIEKNEILLPDFQRDFVWRDEEQQKQLIASVLCKMPVGSILLLEAKPDDYAANVIGCAKKKVETNAMNAEVEFLLDGQQRITVLANVFSNVIHENCKKVSELIAPMALKRRFFLALPKWKNRPDRAEDWFGVNNLCFPMSNPDKDLPEFLTSQIYSYIHVETFTANDKKPYNPSQELTPALDTYCLNSEDKYLIPLFLLCPTEKKQTKIILRFKEIIESIADNIKKEIVNQYMSYDSDVDKENFIKYIFEDAEDIVGKSGDERDKYFENNINERQQVWQEKIKEYLKACVSKLELNQIRVKASQRARAIDIYENLNRGGVCLNTFDLLMARVAKVNNKENFNQRIKRLMQENKKYPDNVLPDNIKYILSPKLKDNSYNATMSMGCYNKNKNEISSKYVDVFLDVLGICCRVPDLKPDEIKLEYIKKNYILDLMPEQIDKNCDKVIVAIDRAMYFLQTRCGVRTIQEVNYSLMIVLIAIVFFEDTKFFSREVHELLEGWYWSILFSGEYDKDQNTNFISNLKNILKTIRKDKDCSWMETIIENVFKLTNFSDEKLLLMDKAEDDRLPKNVLKIFICQYMLSKTYCDMFDTNKKISVFAQEAKDLEAHHIVPLGAAKNIKESSDELRDNPKHICNSPVNFVLITKQSNKMISDKPLEIYAKEINDQVKSVLHINDYLSNDDANTNEKIHKILEKRLSGLRGDVLNTIQHNLGNWKY